MKLMQGGEEAETILEVEIANTGGGKVLVTGSKRKMLCFIFQISYQEKVKVLNRKSLQVQA